MRSQYPPIQLSNIRPEELGIHPEQPLSDGGGEFLNHLYGLPANMNASEFFDLYNRLYNEAMRNPTRENIVGDDLRTLTALKLIDDVVRTHHSQRAPSSTDTVATLPYLPTTRLHPDIQHSGWLPYLPTLSPGPKDLGATPTMGGTNLRNLSRILSHIPESEHAPIIAKWEQLKKDASFLAKLSHHMGTGGKLHPGLLPFLRAIHDAPYDAAPRLIHADYLDESSTHPLTEPYTRYLRADARYGEAIASHTAKPDLKALAKPRKAYEEARPVREDWYIDPKKQADPKAFKSTEYHNAVQEISPALDAPLTYLNNYARTLRGLKPVKFQRTVNEIPLQFMNAEQLGIDPNTQVNIPHHLWEQFPNASTTTPRVSIGEHLDNYKNIISEVFRNGSRKDVALARLYGRSMASTLTGLNPVSLVNMKGPAGVGMVSRDDVLHPAYVPLIGQDSVLSGPIGTFGGLAHLQHTENSPIKQNLSNWKDLMSMFMFVHKLYGHMHQNNLERINPTLLPFLKAIHDAPQDAAPRLVHADVVDENFPNHPLTSKYTDFLRADARYGSSIITGEGSKAKQRGEYQKARQAVSDVDTKDTTVFPLKKVTSETSPMLTTPLTHIGNYLRDRMGKKPLQMSRWVGNVHPVFYGDRTDGPIKLHPQNTLNGNQLLEWARQNIHSSMSMRHLAAIIGWLPGTTTTMWARRNGRAWHPEQRERLGPPTEIEFETRDPEAKYQYHTSLEVDPHGGRPHLHGELMEISQDPSNVYRGVSAATVLRQLRAAHEVGIPRMEYTAAWIPPHDPLSGLLSSRHNGQTVGFTGGLHWPLLGGDGYLPQSYKLPPDIEHEVNVATGGTFRRTRLISDLFASPRGKQFYIDNPIHHDGFMLTAPGTYSRRAMEKHVAEQSSRHGFQPPTPDREHSTTLVPLQLSHHKNSRVRVPAHEHQMVTHLIQTGSLHPEHVDDYFRFC